MFCHLCWGSSVIYGDGKEEHPLTQARFKAVAVFAAVLGPTFRDTPESLL
jgi:hypothetical protein